MLCDAYLCPELRYVMCNSMMNLIVNDLIEIPSFKNEVRHQISVNVYAVGYFDARYFKIGESSAWDIKTLRQNTYILTYDSHNFFGRNAKFYPFDSFTQASIRDGNGNTALHLACINDDLNTIEALLKPITTAELKEYQQITNQLPQSNASQYFSIDLEQRNFYGK